MKMCVKTKRCGNVTYKKRRHCYIELSNVKVVYSAESDSESIGRPGKEMVPRPAAVNGDL